MPIRLLTLTSAAFIMLLAGPIVAQEQVTVLNRNGERVSGRFEAWNRQADTVYVRVSLGDQRIIPMRDVALIDVGGGAENLPPAEVEAAKGGEHVLVTRSGELLRGRVANIDGGEGSGADNEPRMVTFQAGGERRFRMSDVARLYVGNFPQPQTAVPAPATDVKPADIPAGSLYVPGNQQWTPANIVVRRGDRVQFEATGEVRLSGDEADRAVSAGSLTGRHAPNAPAPQFLAGALIGRIGGGAPFAIGNQTVPLTMSAAGSLFLGVNDDDVNDNAGGFTVAIRVTRGR